MKEKTPVKMFGEHDRGFEIVTEGIVAKVAKSETVNFAIGFRFCRFLYP